MKNLSFIIAMVGLFIGLTIIELTMFQSYYFFSLIITFITAGYTYSMSHTSFHGLVTQTLQDWKPEKLSKLVNSSRHTYIFNQFSVNDLKLFIDVLTGDDIQLPQAYTRFTYLNDIERHHTSYIYQLFYLFKNDLNTFLKLKKIDKKTENLIFEDNIKTKEPGKIYFDKVVFELDLTVFDDIYFLYQNSYDFEYLDNKRYAHNVYNYIKEKALYYYLYNTEQHKEQHKYWKQSDFIFDEFLEEQQ